MPRQFFSGVKRIAERLTSGGPGRDAKLSELRTEIAALNRRIEIQDGDIAFAQSILCRYTAEIETLMQENMRLRREIA